MIKLGANVNAKTKAEQTPLMLAAKYERLADLKALVRAGADIDFQNSKDDSALVLAATEGRNPEVIKTLVNLGATVDLPDYSRRTPLVRAAGLNPNPKIV